jgi:hypothetical protein
VLVSISLVGKRGGFNVHHTESLRRQAWRVEPQSGVPGLKISIDACGQFTYFPLHLPIGITFVLASRGNHHNVILASRVA